MKAAALVCILLAGCASDADYQRDKQLCEAQASRAAQQQVGAHAAAAEHNRVLLGCMAERGWKK